ncbi:MAG: site-specific integrase [Lactimicrobium sp.]|jgi:integrase|uniref:site-specific integrase n=1 Tax=Lactimicrobium sp. TaxID=2563780 RepID=UPI002F360059
MIAKDEKRNTWYVQVKIKDPLTGKWHTHKKRGFATKREAKQYESSLSTSDEIPTSKTFLQIAHEWEISIQSSPASIRQHNEHFKMRFADLKDRQLRSITRSDLILWRNELSQSDFATKTKNVTLTYVRAVFQYAADVYGYPNPARTLKNLKRTDQEVMQEMQVWTPEEFNSFLACVDNPLYRAYFDALYWTGMRRGEAIALQCSDLSDGWINIHASQRDASTGLKPTKTKAARKIQIDDALNDELMALKKAYKAGYLFGGESALSPTQISRIFNAAIKQSGVKKIRLHDLRHSHATWLINHGVNIVAVSKRLGHSSIEQTLKTYTHLLESTDNEMMKIINNSKNGSTMVPR